jgi:hypothetical protein
LLGVALKRSHYLEQKARDLSHVIGSDLILDLCVYSLISGLFGGSIESVGNFLVNHRERFQKYGCGEWFERMFSGSALLCQCQTIVEEGWPGCCVGQDEQKSQRVGDLVVQI